MDLLKKNIHMDCYGNTAVSQITLEEDFVIPDTKPDIQKIIFENSKVKIDEAKPNGEHVAVAGELEFCVLYQTDNEMAPIARVSKSVPFKEDIYLEGALNTDNIDYLWELDDLSVGIINSRKINMRSALTIKVRNRRIMDEEAAVEIYGDEPVEYRKKVLDVVGLSICKKDIYRIRQDMEIGNNLPNIKEILWESLNICNIDFRMQSGKILIQGELNVFVLFEGEGEERPIRFYENTIPFNGEVECSGGSENMISDIMYRITNVEIEKKADFDGEERILTVEIVLGLDIKLYEEERISLLCDVYGINTDIMAETVEGTFRNILIKNDAKCRVDEKIKVKGDAPMLQVLHCEGEAMIEETKMIEDAVEITGTLLMKCMYVTGDDKMPYCSFKDVLPFSYTMDAKGIDAGSIVNVNACVERMNLTLVDSEELEVKAFINLSAIVFKETKEEIISNLNAKAVDMDRMNKLPSMAVYVVKEGDSLWDIGKKYYVPVKKIKELNGLTQDECRAMDKLLIVKD